MAINCSFVLTALASLRCHAVCTQPAYGRIWTLWTQFPEHPVGPGSGCPAQCLPLDIFDQVSRVSIPLKPEKGHKRHDKMPDRLDLPRYRKKHLSFEQKCVQLLQLIGTKKNERKQPGWMKKVLLRCRRMTIDTCPAGALPQFKRDFQCLYGGPSTVVAVLPLKFSFLQNLATPSYIFASILENHITC